MDRTQPPASATLLVFPIASLFIPAITFPVNDLIPTIGLNRIIGKLIKEDSQPSCLSPSQLDGLLYVLRGRFT